MALTSTPTLRWTVFGGMAASMLGLVALGFWPLIRADRQLQAFCAEQTAGRAPAELQALAAERGYTVAASGASLLVDDPSGFGRRQCLLALDAQGRVAGSAR